MKKFTYILIITFSIFFVNINTKAISGGYSGVGQGQGYKGGKECSTSGCKCTGGACLAAAAGIKFTLVDISNSKLEAKAYGYMKTVGNKYGGEYFFDKNYSGNGDKLISGAIEGIILENGDYSYEAYTKENYVELPSFEKMSTIIKNGEGGLNFYEDELKKSILIDNNCSSKGVECILTEEFTKLSEILLRKANIISSTDSLSYISNEQKQIISNLRIIIEPVYALYLNGYKDHKFIFSTPKSIAHKVASNDFYDKNPVLGIYNLGYRLYNQLHTLDTLKTIINYPSYIVPLSDKEKIDAFLNLSSGAGYSIAKIIYDDTKCDIRKNNDTYTYIDSNGIEFENDLNGYNLNYYLNEVSSGCGCNIFNANSYKDDILNSSENFQEIYDNMCTTPIVKSCEYEISGSNYKYYDESGNELSDYTNFVIKCGCNNINVLALKDKFSTEYYAECPPPTLPSNFTKVSSNLKKCTVENNTENYEIQKVDTKTINEHCSLSCTETINFNDVYGKYIVKAGQYFELGKYPSLIATKNCEVNVKYNDWYNNYINLANDQAKYATETNKYNSVSHPSSSSELCSCPKEGPCTYATKYYATYTTYIFDGSDFRSNTATESWGGCAQIPKPITDSTASNKFSETIGKIENLYQKLKTCSVYLYMLDGTTKTDSATSTHDYYTFTGDLKYYYYQNYSNPNIGIKRNDDKPKNIDDSNMTRVPKSSIENGNYLSYKENTKTYKYFSSLNNITSKNVGVNNYNVPITRIVELKFDYIPSISKSVDIFTADIENGTSDNKNKIDLSKVYDIDISAVAKENNENYFSFISLGDDNKIFEWFRDGKKVKINGYERNANINDSIDSDLNRACTYGIDNDLVKCDSSNNCKLNIIYRSVDPAKIDPNERLKIDADGDIGFSNWDNKKGYLVKEKIEKTEKTKDTYSPNNLEYSFTLDSATIAAIKDYNETSANKYDNWEGDFDCINGNECESKFITQAKNGTFKDKNNNNVKAFVKNTNGRNKWKYMTYNESSLEWSIENYDKGAMTQALFEAYKQKLGGLTP